MTSKIVVNNIEADAGVSTVTFGSEISASKITTSSGEFTVGTGVTLNSPSDNVLNIQTNGSTRITVGAGGSVHIGGSGEIYKLQVTGPPANGTNYGILHIRDSQTLSGAAGTGGIFLSSSPGTDYYIAKGYNGSSTRLKFGNANNATEYMAIDDSGRVTKPYQPCFSVYRGFSDQTIPHNTSTKVEWNIEVFDIGSNFDSSTNYRFTAPVAGKYLFMGHLYIYSTYQVEAYVYKNGSSYKRFSGPVGSGGNDNPNGMSFMDIVDLAVNDYVEIYIYHQRAGDTAAADIYGGGIKETSFVGYLIG